MEKKQITKRFTDDLPEKYKEEFKVFEKPKEALKTKKRTSSPEFIVREDDELPKFAKHKTYQPKVEVEDKLEIKDIEPEYF